MTRSERFRIEYAEAALRHLRDLSARERAQVLNTVVQQLEHQPTTPTRNRKLLRANSVAPWELRIGDLRVYFDVQESPVAVVSVRAVGKKVREKILIGGAEVEIK
jgi:mRNA-degrading endonuclease RelE of RelBE toxin-antitoxin system